MVPHPHPKRRKLRHANNTNIKHGLIDFKAPSASRLSTASTFILQADELLKEVRLPADSKALEGAADLLHRLRALIDGIEPHGPIPLTEASQSLRKRHDVAIPFPLPAPPPDAQYKFSFARPKCNVVGSFVSMTMVQTDARFPVVIDLVVEMPPELFQPKDFLDMRYFYRRAYFLACVAAELRTGLGDTAELSFSHLHDNPLLPILSVRPVKKPDSAGAADGPPPGFSVHVIPHAPPGAFQKAKLRPALCCNRLPDVVEGKNRTTLPSPFYNSTLKAEETLVYYMRVLAAARTKCPAFLDACVLGRTWLHQRGFGGPIARGGFGNFEWAVIAALLLGTGGRNSQPLLSASLSSTELFKGIVQFLSTASFVRKPFVFGSLPSSAQGSVQEKGPVMFDPGTELNILFKMSPWSALWLQQHAKSTTGLLSKQHLDHFQYTFITNVDQPLQNFDLVFTIRVAGSAATPAAYGWQRDLQTYKTLTRALGARVQHVHIQPTASPSLSPSPSPFWPLGATAGDSRDLDLAVGIVFDPAHMGRTMEYGPAAEEQREAEKFRRFWGERAELRRFKNGSILECVEWTKRTAPEICEEIVRYSLGKHLGIGHEHLVFAGTTAFSTVIPMTHMDRPAFDAAVAAFRTLESDLRGLDGMLLQIRHVAPLSPSLRYTSVVVPAIGRRQDALAPIDVGLSFEASSRWPDNLVAVQHAKIEFLLDIGKRLGEANEEIKTFLGRENVGVGNENLAFLDVVYPDGAVFRLRISADAEESMLDRQVKDRAVADEKTRADAEGALQAFRWRSKTLPLHSQAISTHCTRMPPLSPAIRLVKHWFSRQLLAGHFGPELIELFVLHAFLRPYPWRTPSSPATGFLRTMFFLSRWDWRQEPLIVDWWSDGDGVGDDDTIASNDTPSASDGAHNSSTSSSPAVTAASRADMQHELEGWRRRDPNMNRLVLFVATPHDSSGLAYTQAAPSRMAAMRMTRLATAACQLAREHGTALDPTTLFRTPVRDYDVLLHLSPKAVKAVLREASSAAAAAADVSGVVKWPPSLLSSSLSRFKNLDPRTGKLPLPVARHPATVLLDELRRVYADTLVFFHGTEGDDAAAMVIAAIWHPSTVVATAGGQRRQSFRVGLPWNCRAVEELGDDGDDDGDKDDGAEQKKGAVVEVNRHAVLGEIARIGGDLIRKIEEVVRG